MAILEMLVTAGCGRLAFESVPGPEDAGGSATDGDSIGDEVPMGYHACGGCLCVDQPSEEGLARMFCPRKLTWMQAAEACRSANMQLARPRSASDSRQMRAQAHAAQIAGDVWLGGSDREDEGTWRWLDGTIFFRAPVAGPGFVAWDREEPDDSLRQEDCLELQHVATGRWSDRDCRQVSAFVCENRPAPSAPEPSSLIVRERDASLVWQLAPGTTEPESWLVVLGHTIRQEFVLPPRARSIDLASGEGLTTVAVRAFYGAGKGAGNALTTGFIAGSLVGSIEAPANRSGLMSVSGGASDTVDGMAVYRGSQLQVEVEAAVGWALASAESRRGRRLVLELQIYDAGAGGLSVSGSFVGSLGEFQRADGNVMRTFTVDLTPHLDADGHPPTLFTVRSEAAGNSDPLKLRSAALRLLP